MADTPRSRAALLAMFADNTSGDITPQDTRDLIVSAWVGSDVQPMFNVKAAAYGATGDGATNDTSAIETAITAATAAGGGVVFFPPGTYMCTKLTLPAKVTLAGSGPDATTLKLIAGTNTALVETSGFVTTDTDPDIYSFGIRDLTIDGNSKTGTNTQGLINICGSDYVLDNIRVTQAKTYGIYSNFSSSGSAPAHGHSMESSWSAVKVHDCGGDGVYFNGPHDSRLVNCTFYSNTGVGLNIQARGNSIQLTNCHSWGTSQTYAYTVSGTGCGFTNCLAEGASVAQVQINANDGWWVGGYVFPAGGASTAFTWGAFSGGWLITTKSDCTTCFAFGTNDGGGIYTSIGYIGSGAFYTGTLSGLSTLVATTTNGAGPAARIAWPTTLRTTDPGIAGELWSNSGVITKS